MTVACVDSVVDVESGVGRVADRRKRRTQHLGEVLILVTLRLDELVLGEGEDIDAHHN